MKFSIFLTLLSLLFWNTSNAQSTATKANSKTDDLKILSWNIYMLPFIIFNKSEKKDRARDISDELNQLDYDIILFQEAFKKNARRVLRKKLREKYPYFYGPANQKRLSFRTNSGLYTFSKTPLIYKGDVQFTECSGHDCMARKGAMMLQGTHNGKIFQVVSTHTNGGTDINNSQFHQIYDELLLPYQQEGVPQIIGGDMNCRKTDPKYYNEMLSILDAKGGETIGLNYTNWEKSNIIDHFLVRDNNSDLMVKQRANLVIGPDWANEIKRPARASIGLSDHYPIDIIVNW